jgi:ABC-type uncharacterized transport system ATPase subunit
VYVIDLERADVAEVELLATRLRGVPGVTALETSGPQLRVAVAEETGVAGRLLAELGESGVAVVRFERQRPTLEDVFLQLVGREGRAAA